MPQKDKDEYNSYMKEYMLQRYHQRRKEAFDKLGGKCNLCGCIPDEYEFDHIDPATKEFSPCSGWSVSQQKWDDEIAKCQVLCKPCHISKSIRERDQIQVKGKDVHGTLSSVRYCKCDLCRAAKNKYDREWKRKKKLEKQNKNKDLTVG